ncbi:MAG: glutamine-hydrolyzing carbamoyl-phosphate synthase small subunit [Treponema sp.]|nr:glutamine-hydrolyzing carbamoyl-phosphate synthase small subunit [Treponema sp.]
MKTAYLILENGIVFKGQAFGAEVTTLGEIVFTTAMTGYLETLTDPSYYGQIVLQTFPLIGNYGVIPEDFEAENIALSAYIVKYPCELPSNFRSVESLDALLKKRGVAGLCGIDTRMLTRIIRSSGVLNGKITYTEPTEEDRAEAAAFKLINPVQQVSLQFSTQRRKDTKTQRKTAKNSLAPLREELPKKIALLDYGAKGGIEEALVRRNCAVTRFAHAASADEILAVKPSGIVLSNGPGDPADPANAVMIETIRALEKSGTPLMGICLGHQLLALAMGFKTHKMKFGHRGANQAVKDMATGRVYVTSQNHGYAVDADTAVSSFINVNDGTNEGLDYGVSFSVQFHPEAQGGPLDTSFLFDRFMDRIDNYAGR